MNIKFIETRSFLKMIIVMIIATIIAIPASYVFLNDGTGTGVAGYTVSGVTEKDTTTPPYIPPPDDDDDDDGGDVVFSSGSNNNGGGGGGSGSNGGDGDGDGDGDGEFPKATRILPNFIGNWYLVNDSEPLGYNESQPLGNLTGNMLGCIQVEIQADGSTVQIGDTTWMLSFRGNYTNDDGDDDPIRIRTKLLEKPGQGRSDFIDFESIVVHYLDVDYDSTGSCSVSGDVFTSFFLWDDPNYPDDTNPHEYIIVGPWNPNPWD